MLDEAIKLLEQANREIAGAMIKNLHKVDHMIEFYETMQDFSAEILDLADRISQNQENFEV